MFMLYSSLMFLMIWLVSKIKENVKKIMFEVRTCEVNDTACVFVEPVCQTISRYLHQNVKGPRTGNTERWHSDEILSKIPQMFIFLCWIRICNQIFQIRFQSPATGHWRLENNKMTFSKKSMQTWCSMF